MAYNKKKCVNCVAYAQCRDSAVSWLFLFVGLLATIAVRLVNIATGWGSFWPKFFWYLGVAGFFVYFLYKFRQDRQMQQVIASSATAEKLSQRKPLTAQDYALLHGLVCRLKSTKDAINYFFIFFSSAVVLAVALYQDFFRK